MALPVGICDLANREGWARHLSFYIHLKAIRVNSKIYSYSSRTLSNQLKSKGFNYSKDTVNRSVRFLLDKGLVSIQNGHLILLGKHSFNGVLRDWYVNEDKACHKIIQIIVDKSITKQTKYIQFRQIQKVIQQQESHFVKKQDLMKMNSRANNSKANVTVRECRMRNKLIREFGTMEKGEIVSTDVFYSLDSIASDLNISKTSANELKKLMVSKGLLSSQIIGGREITNKMSLKNYELNKDLFGCSTFWYKGYVYETPKCMLGLGRKLRADRTTKSSWFRVKPSKEVFIKKSKKNETVK